MAHIRKHKGRWAGVVELGKDPETGKRKQKWVYGKTKKEVQEKVVEIENQVNKNEYFEPDNMTVSEYMDYWLKKYCKTNIGPRTYKTYTNIITNHIKPNIGHLKIYGLKPLHLIDFYNKLEDKNATAVYVHRILSESYKHARQWQLIRYNPILDIDPPKQQKKTNYKVWTSETTSDVINQIEDTILYIPILLAATTGMRRGEICGLRWEDIDFDNCYIYIRKQLQRFEGKLTLDKTKTHKSERPISIDEDVINILKHHKEYQDSCKDNYKDNYVNEIYTVENNKIETTSNTLVCTWPNGRPIDPDYLTKQFPKLAAKLGIEKIRFHDLRHSYATELLRNNVNIKIISEILRHSSIKITGDIYSHPDIEMQRIATKIVAKNILKKNKNDEENGTNNV
jgi:integrase